MTQIQQLTALAFARDDREHSARPTPPPAASDSAAQADTQPDTAVTAAEAPAAVSTSAVNTGGTGRSGSSAAAAAADFADARTDGSEWASGFIAEARRQNEAQASTGLSGEAAGMSCPTMWTSNAVVGINVWECIPIPSCNACCMLGHAHTDIRCKLDRRSGLLCPAYTETLLMSIASLVCQSSPVCRIASCRLCPVRS